MTPHPIPAAHPGGLLHGLRDSLAIAAGYLPAAFSFGVSALQSGVPPEWVMLVSLVVYAGASQFALIGLLASGATPLTIVPTLWLMNARHLLYGAPVVSLLTGPARIPTPLLAFGLTDEVFATATARLERIQPAGREGWFLGLALGAYGSWLLGTALGLVAGAGVLDRLPMLRDAFSFVLPGLFVALLMDMGWRLHVRTVAVSAGVSLLLLPFWPAHLVIPAALVAGALAAGLTGAPRTQPSAPQPPASS